MESRRIKLTGIILMYVIFGPAAVTCQQSRGEIYRGEGTADNKGYLRGRMQQTQAQLQGRPYPEYYQPDSQSQLYSHPTFNSQNNYYPYPDYQNQPELYSQINSQPSPHIQQTPQINSQQPFLQQFAQDYDRPAYVAPTFNTPRPKPSQNNNKIQSQPNSNLATRLGQNDANRDPQAEVFSTRPPKPTRQPTTTVKPPIYLDTRFDDRGSPSFKKTLSFDSGLSTAMETFALELLQHLHARLDDDNFMVSPFSVYHLMVLIAEGAKGQTYEEINEKLKLGSIERTRDFQQYLTVALNQNSADVILKKFAMLVTDKNRPVKNSYETTVEKVYDADVVPVNFLEVDKTVNEINGQVSNLTLGQITDTVRKEDLFKAQLILLSGLFFQGRWMNVFNTTFTKQEPFYDTDGNKKGQVNMMFQRGPFAYSAVGDLGCHVLELPYAEQPLGNRNDAPSSGLSMILVLPRKGLSLEEAIGNIYQHGMDKIYRELYNSKAEYEDDEVEVHIPRFEITTSLNMQDTLEGLGIREVFDQSRADLSNINNQYFISSMIHKTKISVDERGTTASAVTTSIFANKATPPKFHANKPFLFFIVDKVTKLILFSGQYTNPELY